MQASDGNFYGTTVYGGTGGEGTLYQVRASTFGVNIPYDFSGLASDPIAGLVQGSDGNLYGITNGSANIYSWDLADNAYEALYNIGYGDFVGSMIQDTDGLFYGTSGSYGAHNDGYVYSFDNGLSPFVAFVKSQGKVGATAEILGQGFTGTTSVTFNGVAATSSSVVSDTYVTARGPDGRNDRPRGGHDSRRHADEQRDLQN